MRGSGWLLPGFAMIAWVVCVAYPIVGASLHIPHLPRTDVELRHTWQLLATSVGWAGAIALGAMLVGWIPGRLLGSAMHSRRFVPIASFVLVPICLPSYIVFYAWWQSWPADSMLYQWLVQHQHVHHARLATLYLGLLCWSWPLVALCVAGSVAFTPAQRIEMLALDGAGWGTRFIDRLRTDGRGLMLGGLLAFLAAINNTTCFDLAEVFTFANELRAIKAVGANARDALVAGWPSVAIAAVGAIGVWGLLGARRDDPATRPAGVMRSTMAASTVIWLVSVLLPVGLFTRNVLDANFTSGGISAIKEFFMLYGRSALNTAIFAMISAGLAALIAVGMAAAWQDHRRWVRHCANLMGAGWLLMGLLPGTIVGVALEAAYNTTTPLDPLYVRVFDPVAPATRGMLQDLIYSRPTILFIAHLASFGFVAALFGRWAAMAEPSAMNDLRRLDGAQTLRGQLTSAWPRLLAAAVPTFAIVLVLAMGEIPVTAQVHPPHRPGAGPLALTLLNDMHYQRPQSVMVAAIALMTFAITAAGVVAVVWRLGHRSLRPSRASTLALLMLFLVGATLSGCVPDDPDNVPPFNARHIFGRPGRALGQLGYPRAIDIDLNRQVLYIIDKTARVQRFGIDGTPQLQWQMPESENGMPTGVSVAPDGRVFVPDTHYHRVIIYDSEGHELARFGEFGRGPGQFIYPTDVTFDAQGRIYVSEYGGNDRVQVFSPEGTYLFEFGVFGRGWGEFNRPQSIAFNKARNELYIADACNHRIVVVDPSGAWLRTFGSAGRGAGQLAYPYSVTVLDDGSVIVCEFGNNRVQHLDAAGTCLGLYGRVGRKEGELQYPWAAVAGDRDLFVLDSGNNRVQVMRKP